MQRSEGLHLYGLSMLLYLLQVVGLGVGGILYSQIWCSQAVALEGCTKTTKDQVVIMITKRITALMIFIIVIIRMLLIIMIVSRAQKKPSIDCRVGEEDSKGVNDQAQQPGRRSPELSL